MRLSYLPISLYLQVAASLIRRSHLSNQTLSLFKTLFHFPALSGHLQTNNVGHVHIACNDAGADISHTKAEEMAQTSRQRIAQAEAMARADMLRFQPESGLTLLISSEGILGPLSSELPAEGLDLSDIPPAED